jgi:transmembrane sensor
MNGFGTILTEPIDRQDGIGRDDIESDAALWVARLGGGPLAEVDRQALDRWLGEDDRHAAAFAEAQAAWARMDEVAGAPGALHRDIALARTAQVTALRPSHDRRRATAWLQAAAMAASLLILVAGAGLWFGDPRVMMAADHRTAPGERRVVVLPDGSTAELGPASAIALRYTSAERRVELLSGVAYFTAAPRQDGEQRPFVVEAATGTARALGTQFTVDRFSDSVEVIVIEHEVRVAATSADGQEDQIVLSPGQSVRYAGAGLASAQAVGLDQALAWRRNRLVFDRVPLDHVVAELNRYRRGRIVIGNATLASRTVSGVFDTADPDAALATIARELGARTASAPPLVTLLY